MQAGQDNQTPPSQDSTRDHQDLLQSLRRKEGTWVSWGLACQQLQKSGLNSQEIFEATGFEPIHQNQVTVAAQVYTSLVSGEANSATRQHFEQRGSDILYELRILTQAERVMTAEFVLGKGLDVDEARELAKAFKDLSRLSALPEGFAHHPGDALAYQCWQMARQQSDLQVRSRLIAKGLRFAHSDTARAKVEQLLTDFTVKKVQPMPLMPFYRMESASEMPRIIPVAGKFPLTKADWQAVPMVDEVTAFNLVKFSGAGAWVALPGWQVVMVAEDPIAFLCDNAALPSPLPDVTEEVLVLADRADRAWNANSYFLAASDDDLTMQWFDEEPELPLLGRILLILRPNRILDEGFTRELWQVDE